VRYRRDTAPRSALARTVFHEATTILEEREHIIFEKARFVPSRGVIS
jgi:hypothetical protein